MICWCKQLRPFDNIMISQQAHSFLRITTMWLTTNWDQHNTIFLDGHLVGFIDWDDAAPGTRLCDLANAIYNYVDVSHWSK